MFAMHYEHRLPADYDMQVMRDRAATRGPQWDATPGLVLKAFVARVRGEHGAIGNLYGGVYLWRDAAAAKTLLAGDPFVTVTDTFGRPRVDTWLPLDVQRGPATGRALTLYRHVEAIHVDTAIPAAQSAAVARNRAAIDRPDTVAAWVGLDPATWQVAWFTLSAAAPDLAREGEAYQVLYLAGPGIA